MVIELLDEKVRFGRKGITGEVDSGKFMEDDDGAGEEKLFDRSRSILWATVWWWFRKRECDEGVIVCVVDRIGELKSDVGREESFSVEGMSLLIPSLLDMINVGMMTPLTKRKDQV